MSTVDIRRQGDSFPAGRFKPLTAAMTQKEMASWWNVFAQRLPTVTSKERVEIEDATGCSPLLLKGLLGRVMRT